MVPLHNLCVGISVGGCIERNRSAVQPTDDRVRGNRQQADYVYS